MINKTINLSIYLLRYFSIIKTKYSVSSKIDFGSNLSNNFFKKHLKKCKFYLEYGSGNSTLLAVKYKKKFISIEGDRSFYNYLRINKKINDIKYINIGPTKYFSYPILPFYFIKKKIRKYSNYFEKMFFGKKLIPDLILIDGRFRVNVCLNIIKFLIKNKIKKNILIIVDDYKFRKSYKILNEFFKIKNEGRFGVIKYNDYKKISLKNIDSYLLKSKIDYL
tara:strand:+ start:1629 stop:2291 length:663 start_codon:yes stop_codon:yes gene_type:complete